MIVQLSEWKLDTCYIWSSHSGDYEEFYNNIPTNKQHKILAFTPIVNTTIDQKYSRKRSLNRMNSVSSPIISIFISGDSLVWKC
jgi:hypothetical protein